MRSKLLTAVIGTVVGLGVGAGLGAGVAAAAADPIAASRSYMSTAVSAEHGMGDAEAVARMHTSTGSEAMDAMHTAMRDQMPAGLRADCDRLHDRMRTKTKATRGTGMRASHADHHR